MKSLILSFCASLLLPFLANGRSVVVTNPELDYVCSEHFPDDSIPNTDEVFRLDLDINETGRPVIFLSFGNFTDRSGKIWTAYVPIKGGYRRIDSTSNGDMIQFRTDGFYSFGKNPKYRKRGVYVLYPGRGGAQLSRYEINNGTITSQDLRQINYDKQDDRDFGASVLKHEIGDKDPGAEPATLKTLSVRAIKAGEQ